MSIQRAIINRLNESRSLDEASFESGGSTYKCVFGKYYKDGEEITRDDYFKAKDGGSPSPTTQSKKATPKKSSLSPEIIDKYADPWEERSGDEVLDKSYSKFRERKAEYYIAKEAVDKARKALRDKIRRDLGLPPQSKSRGITPPEFIKAYDKARATDPEYRKIVKTANTAYSRWESSGIQFKKDYQDAKSRGVKIPRDYYGDATEFDDYD